MSAAPGVVSWLRGALRKLKVFLERVGGGSRACLLMGRCELKHLWGGFEVGGRKHPWGLELWPFHYLQFLSPTWLSLLVSRGLGQMLQSLPTNRWWVKGQPFPGAGGTRLHCPGVTVWFVSGLSEPGKRLEVDLGWDPASLSLLSV